MDNDPESNTPTQIYDPEHVQLLGYLRVHQVAVVPNQGGGDLVEVRAGSDGDAPWRSLRWHCRQEGAPKAGEVFQILIARPNYEVMGDSDPQVPPDVDDTFPAPPRE